MYRKRFVFSALFCAAILNDPSRNNDFIQVDFEDEINTALNVF